MAPTLEEDLSNVSNKEEPAIDTVTQADNNNTEKAEKVTADADKGDNDDDDDDGPISASKKKRMRKKKTAAATNQPSDLVEKVENIDLNATKPTTNAAKSKTTKPTAAGTKANNAKKPNAAVERIKQMMELKRQEELRRKLEQEAIQKAIAEEEARLKEQERLAEERRQLNKQKKKENLKKMKEEGRPITKAQKENQTRFQMMVEKMRAEGVNIPFDSAPDFETGTSKKPFIYTKKKKPTQKVNLETVQVESSDAVRTGVNHSGEQNIISNSIEATNLDITSKDDIPDNWEDVLFSDNEDCNTNDHEETVSETVSNSKGLTDPVNEKIKDTIDITKNMTSINVDTKKNLEKTNTVEDTDSAQSAKKSLRAPIICVLGHVDTGKTKILDKLRLTNVQSNEAGGITQQIGITNVAYNNIKMKIKDLPYMSDFKPKIPGILIIDTPGHESFRNLRSRGSSLCDFAILVVDIMHGLELQTIESLKLLTEKRTPFVVALNKIDRLYGWKSNHTICVLENLKQQTQDVKNEFDDRFKFTTLKFAEQGFNIAMFNDDVDFNSYIPVVPTSAHTGDGVNDLIAFICKQSQTYFRKRLTKKHNKFEAIVMEVKMATGMGYIVDVILINGKLKEGDTVVFSRFDEPLVTQIKAIITSKPMTDLRASRTDFQRFKEISESQGIRIFTSGEVDKVLAGTPMLLHTKTTNLDDLIEEAKNNISIIFDNFQLDDVGVYVQASTLGSLEALLDFLRNSKIPFSGINIGPVHKKDVVKASIMLASKPLYAVILAFDVPIDPEIMAFAHKEGVKVFTADIIYHLFDSFMDYTKDYRLKQKEQFRDEAIFPCKLDILPESIFRTRNPIILGVKLEAGFLVKGTPLCIPSKNNIPVGIVINIHLNNKEIEKAVKGQEVSIKIDPLPNTQILCYDQHFNYKNQLVSMITRHSIDILKEYFTDEMKKTDWQLIIELKKIFEII